MHGIIENTSEEFLLSSNRAKIGRANPADISTRISNGISGEISEEILDEVRWGKTNKFLKGFQKKKSEVVHGTVYERSSGEISSGIPVGYSKSIPENFLKESLLKKIHGAILKGN